MLYSVFYEFNKKKPVYHKACVFYLVLTLHAFLFNLLLLLHIYWFDSGESPFAYGGNKIYNFSTNNNKVKKSVRY